MRCLAQIPLILVILAVLLTGCASDRRQPQDQRGVAQAASAPTAAPTAAPPSLAQPDASSSRVEQQTFHSVALDRAMPYRIYLPPGYDAKTQQRYPVLIMLHGIYAGHKEWAAYGLFDQADRLMGSGEIPPFIIVLPEGEQDYWVNHADGGPRWGDYTAQDVVREIDGRYRTLTQREKRAVGGLSMGGHGALQLGINYNDTFGVVGAHAATLREPGTMPDFFGDEAFYMGHYPRPLFRDHPDQAKRLKIWIDVGNGDEWRPGVEAFHNQLVEEGIPHEWHVFEGIHHDSYWTRYAPDYLRFYGEAFR